MVSTHHFCRNLRVGLWNIAQMQAPSSQIPSKLPIWILPKRRVQRQPWDLKIFHQEQAGVRKGTIPQHVNKTNIGGGHGFLWWGNLLKVLGALTSGKPMNTFDWKSLHTRTCFWKFLLRPRKLFCYLTDSQNKRDLFQNTYLTRKVFLHAWIHLTFAKNILVLLGDSVHSVIFNSIYLMWPVSSLLLIITHPLWLSLALITE